MFSKEYINQTEAYSACFTHFMGEDKKDVEHRMKYVPQLVEYILDVFIYRRDVSLYTLCVSSDDLWWAVDDWIEEIGRVNLEEAVDIICDIFYNYSFEELSDYIESLFMDSEEAQLYLKDRW
jgi:hypothetical protein